MNARQTIQNLINGNLADAKRSAKGHSAEALYNAGINIPGVSLMTAANAANYLKGKISWEQYCERTTPVKPKTNAATCDPAAVYGIAASLDAFAHRFEFRGNISDAYNGADQFMREIMKLGEAFETWANAHVDFDQLADVWPYMLQDKFAVALEAARPGAILILDKLTPADFAAIAQELELTLKK